MLVENADIMQLLEEPQNSQVPAIDTEMSSSRTLSEEFMPSPSPSPPSIQQKEFNMSCSGESSYVFDQPSGQYSPHRSYARGHSAGHLSSLTEHSSIARPEHGSGSDFCLSSGETTIGKWTVNQSQDLPTTCSCAQLGSIPESPTSPFPHTPKDSVRITSVAPGPVWPSLDQLEVAHSYGIRRDDSTFTRLIRADELPTHIRTELGMFERQGPEGLILVPQPTQPVRISGQVPIVSRSLLSRLPSINSTRTAAPTAFPSQSTPIASIKTNIDAVLFNYDPPSTYNDSPSRSTPRSANTRIVPPQRRQKIYCDKWVHEGVCAFTQVGCRYLHKMPSDKLTLTSLGLPHGPPAWWGRQIQPTLRAAEPIASAQSFQPTHEKTTGSWRRQHVVPAPDREERALSTTPLSSLGYGPIAPPRSAYSGAGATMSPATKEEGEIDEYDDELLFGGY